MQISWSYFSFISNMSFNKPGRSKSIAKKMIRCDQLASVPVRSAVLPRPACSAILPTIQSGEPKQTIVELYYGKNRTMKPRNSNSKALNNINYNNYNYKYN